MGILKTKVWSPWDVALLKGAVLFFGMIVGAYTSSFVKHFLWIFIILVIVFAIRPFYYYWIKK